MKWFSSNNTSSRTVGIAVEPAGTAAAVVDWIDGGVKIEELAFLPGDDADAAASLKRWVTEQKLTGLSCYPVLSTDQVAIHQIERPPVTDDELEEAARWKVKDSLDIPLEDVVIETFDYPEDAQRSQSLVNVAVVRQADVRVLIDRVKQAGLTIAAIDIPELALRNVASLYTELGRAIAVFTHDGNQGTILLYRDGQLYLSRQVNASAFTPGEAGQAEVEMLCLEIQRSLDYFESQLHQVAPRRLLVYATSQAAELAGAIGNNLSLEVEVLDLTRLGIEVGRRELDTEPRISSVHAVGAALRQELR